MSYLCSVVRNDRTLWMVSNVDVEWGDCDMFEHSVPALASGSWRKLTLFGKISRSVKRYGNPLPPNINIQRFQNTNLFGGTNVHVESSFEKLRKASISFVFSVCLFVRPHGTTRFLLHGFSWNLIYQYFSKVCLVNLSFFTIWQHWRALYMKDYVNYDNISLISS